MNWAAIPFLFFLSLLAQKATGFAFFGDLFTTSSTGEQTTVAPSSEAPSRIVEISDDLFKNLSSITDLNTLHDLLGIPKEVVSASQPRNDLDLRILKIGKLTKLMDISDQYLTNPKQAHCEPQLEPVDLGLVNTYDVSYYPTCVRVKRCGGCCPQKDIFSCQPTASKKQIVKVLVLRSQATENKISSRVRQRGGRGRRRTSNYEYETMNVTVEEHTECGCGCRLKESECNLNVHHYSDKMCDCICKNADEEEKCSQKKTHVWSKKECQCLCRNIFHCSSSETFDHNTCSCVKIKTSIDLEDLFFRSSDRGEKLIIGRRKPEVVPLE